MNTPTLRQTREQVASTLGNVIDKIEDLAGALAEAERAGVEVRAELAACPRLLTGSDRR